MSVAHPTISVVIPCRNGAEFLGEALDSVRAQTLGPLEVIVVDDRSVDGSAAIARAHGATVLCTGGSGGTAVARNIGWRHARGELIAFLDADDRWRPRHLEVVSRLLLLAPEAVLAWGSIEFFGMRTGRYSSHLEASARPVDARVLSAANCPVPQTTVIVPRSELEAIGGYDESLKAVEDFDLFARLSHRGPFIGCGEITGDYRQHEAQTTRFRNRQVAIEFVQVCRRSLDALRGVLPADALPDVEERIRRNWAAELRDAWRSGVGDTFDVLLAMHALVPGSESVVREWRVRRLLFYHPFRLILAVGRRLRLRQIWDRTVRPGLHRLRSTTTR